MPRTGSDSMIEGKFLAAQRSWAGINKCSRLFILRIPILVILIVVIVVVVVVVYLSAQHVDPTEVTWIDNGVMKL